MPKLPHYDYPDRRPKAAIEPILCVPKLLPRDQWVPAAEAAVRINPLNLPVRRMRIPRFEDTPERIAVLTTRYWSPNTTVLTVGFMDNPSAELRKKILSHMNAWNKSVNLKFRVSKSEPQVRIARIPNAGHWSYVGTEILTIAPHYPTMNLDSFTIKTPESEFRRVVRHETGHTLGCWHEHLRKDLIQLIDPEKAFDYYGRTQGWNKDYVLRQVLTPIEESSLLGTERSEPDSIMCYDVPGSVTKNGKPIIGGKDITTSDYAFMAKLYPKPNGRSITPRRKLEPKKNDIRASIRKRKSVS